MRSYILLHRLWVIPLICMAIITPFTPSIDLAISRFFYNRGLENSTHFVSHPIFDFFYTYALLPGQILVLFAIIALACSYIFSYWAKWRKPALVLVLTLAIGAGIIVHSMLKDHWGRPRPRQVIEFGGQQQFRPYYKPNFFHQPEPSKSFPCGHCTMGFYFFAAALVANRYNKRTLAFISILIAIVLGIGLGVTRMAQGGHFFSDVIFSALVMWLTALTIDWMVYKNNDDRVN